MHIQSSRYGRQSFHQWQMTSPSCHVWRFNPQPLYTPDVCESSLEILSRKETLQKRFGSESFWHSTLVAKMIQASCLVFASFQWLNFKGWFNKDRTFFSNSGRWSLNAAVIKNVRGVPQALLNFTWIQASRTVRPRPAANNLALSGMLAASLTLMRWSCDQKKRNQLWCGQTRDNGLKSILHTCPTKSCKITNSQTYVFNNHQKFPTKIIRCYYTGCIISVYVVSAVLFLDIRSAYYAICRDAMTQKSETLEEFSESVACVTVLNCGFVYDLRVRVVCEFKPQHLNYTFTVDCLLQLT